MATQNGNKRFAQLVKSLYECAGIKLNEQKRILDFGCGQGEFLASALEHGMDAYGVDMTHPGNDQSMDALFLKKFVTYDGTILPFDSNYFDYIYSWFVLEHIEDMPLAIKEIVRVLKPGGVTALYSQDGRNSYEGHAKIPWPPFLPKIFHEAYLKEWNIDNSTVNWFNTTNYVTLPEVSCLLEFFGMKLIYTSNIDEKYFKNSLYIRTMDDVINAASQLKRLKASGQWSLPKEQIVIIAQKI